MATIKKANGVEVTVNTTIILAGIKTAKECKTVKAVSHEIDKVEKVIDELYVELGDSNLIPSSIIKRQESLDSKHWDLLQSELGLEGEELNKAYFGKWYKGSLKTEEVIAAPVAEQEEIKVPASIKKVAGNTCVPITFEVREGYNYFEISTEANEKMFFHTTKIGRILESGLLDAEVKQVAPVMEQINAPAKEVKTISGVNFDTLHEDVANHAVRLVLKSGSVEIVEAEVKEVPVSGRKYVVVKTISGAKKEYYTNVFDKFINVYRKNHRGLVV